MFGADRFWSAFERAGMLSELKFTPEGGEAITAKVGFVTPDALLMGEMVQAAQVVIEFPTTALPELVNGSRVTVDDKPYVVRGDPMKKGGGEYSTAELVKK